MTVKETRRFCVSIPYP